MPLAPKRPCSRPYCPRLLAHGEQCPEHGERARKRENDRQPKRRAKRRFYQSPEWRAFREDILIRDPVCKLCGMAPSTCVDHKKTVEECPELALDPENAQGACWPCHSSKTAKQDSGFGNPGGVKSSTPHDRRTACWSNSRAAKTQAPGSTVEEGG